MTAEAWQIVFFTIKVSAFSTLLILPFGIAIAWLLARRDWPGKTFVETAVMLPLFVPPVATGLLLLMLFGRKGPLGSVLDRPRRGGRVYLACRGHRLRGDVFSAARAHRADGVSRSEHTLRGHRAHPWRERMAGLWHYQFTARCRGIVAGAVLAFARAMGEFGATAVVAGMIPRKTMTISLSIYQHIQLGQDAAALPLLLVSIAIVFVTVLCGQIISTRKRL